MNKMKIGKLEFFKLKILKTQNQLFFRFRVKTKNLKKTFLAGILLAKMTQLHENRT